MISEAAQPNSTMLIDWNFDELLLRIRSICTFNLSLSNPLKVTILLNKLKLAPICFNMIKQYLFLCTPSKSVVLIVLNVVHRPSIVFHPYHHKTFVV